MHIISFILAILNVIPNTLREVTSIHTICFSKLFNEPISLSDVVFM